MAAEAIEFLKSYKKLLREIKRAKLKKDIALERATSCGMQNNNTSHCNGISDKVGNGVTESEHWSNVISELNNKAKNIENEIIAYASELSETDEEIITLFYLKEYSPKKIAEKINYSTRQIYRRLPMAEEEFSKIYESCHRCQ